MTKTASPLEAAQNLANAQPATSGYRLLILIILGFSALLRFSALDQVQLRGDQTTVLSLAREALEQRRLPVHSTGSSVGVTPAPLEVWLLMPVAALTSDP